MDNSDQERRTRVDIQWFRALGAYPAVALGVEVSTAVGLFALLGPLIGLADASAPSAFLLTTLALFPTVLAYAELSARTPGPGGSYRLVAPTLPGPGAFLAGWSSLLARLAQEVWRGWTLESTLRSELGGAEVVKLEHRLDEGTVRVKATAYVLEPPTQEEIQIIQRQLEEALDKPVVLRLTVVPVAEFTVP